MEHQHIEEQLTAYLLGDLVPEQAEAMRRHLDKCDDCRALAKELEPTLDLLRGALAVDTGVPERLDDERKEEIFAPRHVPVTVIWLSEHRSVLMRVAGVAAMVVVLAGLVLSTSNMSVKRAQDVSSERRLDRDLEGFESSPQPAPPKPVARSFAEEEAAMESVPTLGDRPGLGRMFRNRERAPEPVAPTDAPFGNLSDEVDAAKASDQDSVVRYQVKSGDTLTAIAAANDTTVRELAELNELQNPDAIRVGGTLAIPVDQPEKQHLWADVSGPRPSPKPELAASESSHTVDSDDDGIRDDWGSKGMTGAGAKEKAGADSNGSDIAHEARSRRWARPSAGVEIEDGYALADGLNDEAKSSFSKNFSFETDGEEGKRGGKLADSEVARNRFAQTATESSRSSSVAAPVESRVVLSREEFGTVRDESRAMESDFAMISPETKPVGNQSELGKGINFDDVRIARLLGDRIEAEVDMRVREAQLDQLSSLPDEELLHASNYAARDETLRSAKNALVDTEVRLNRLMEEHGPDHPDVKRHQAGVEELKKRVSERMGEVRQELRADYQVSKEKYEKLDGVLSEAKAAHKFEDLSELSAQLSEAKALLANGRLEEAEQAFDKVRVTDLYNVEAMQGLKRIEDRRYAKANIDREREVAQLVSQVRDRWNPPLKKNNVAPGEDATESPVERGPTWARLKTTVLPSLEFRNSDIQVVLSDLKRRIEAADPEGSDFQLLFDGIAVESTELTEAPEAHDGEFQVPKITLTLRRITAFDALKIITEYADLDLDVKDGKVMVATSDPVAETESEPELLARAYGVNPFVSANEQPFSTFAIDVDTASYTLMRKHIQNGVLPPAEAVRTEEFVNFFDYDYRAPERQTFAVYTSLAPTPFGDGRLLKIGVKGKRLGREEQRPAVLTFVIDTSGSMDTPDRLGLVRRSLDMLIDELGDADQVAIVQVDSRARLILPPTSLTERAAISAAIEGLQCSGSTHLEDGIKLGYEVAAQAFTGGAVNRVLLLSDGAANLGSADADQILSMVESHRSQGIFCSVFGFGIGAYNDEILEQLANKGDGSYRFIDSQEEAKRVFVDELAATLHVIASDVKIQVEFYPDQVKTYRQLGYENRQLTREQFRDDTVDAGEVGSGESVTALYELVAEGTTDQPLGVVRVRYRDAATGEVEETAHPIRMSDAVATFEETSPPFRLAAAVAEFAEILRGSPFADSADYEAVADVLRRVALELRLDQRVQELLQLVQRAPGLPRASGN